MDRQFGRLFKYLQSTPELRNNTLLLICSDNGPDVGAGSAGPFRGTKATLYEGGTRSPLVVWGPGLVDPAKAGSKNDQSVLAAFDIAPSLLSIAKVAHPEDSDFDGENVASVILGQSTSSRSAPLFWRRPPDRKYAYGAGPLPDLAMRAGEWKLLCEFDGSRPELYRLSNDPGEATNLAEQQPQLVQKMTQAVIAWNCSMPADHAAQLTAEDPKPKAKGKKKISK
jgi:uncharacterized sulfatase